MKLHELLQESEDKPENGSYVNGTLHMYNCMYRGLLDDTLLTPLSLVECMQSDISSAAQCQLKHNYLEAAW